jgi:hypothetical protein
MTNLLKQARFMARPKYMCHSSDGFTENFNDLATAQHWCDRHAGIIKARVAPGQFEIIYRARRSDRSGYPATAFLP